tara:strand:- start:852 stop:1514 length:663 start_codon:yes stop_codon:yes gene_type:complete
MGSAFRQKLEAIDKAREIYVNNNGKEWGFVSKFAQDCGVKQPYVYRIDVISKSKIILASIFSELGANTLYALANAPDAVVEAAAEIVESGDKLSTKDVKRLNESYEDHSEEQRDFANDFVAQAPRPKPEPDYSKNPMNMEKLSVGITSVFWMLNESDYAKNLTAQQLADAIMSNIRSYGGKEQDPMWERRNIEAVLRGVSRLSEAVNYLPKVTAKLKRIK